MSRLLKALIRLFFSRHAAICPAPDILRAREIIKAESIARLNPPLSEKEIDDFLNKVLWRRESGELILVPALYNLFALSHDIEKREARQVKHSQQTAGAK